VDVRDEEIVIKIDESTNTKMRIVRNAISKVFAEGEEEK
jgi:preprotein translocase subunit YajC